MTTATEAARLSKLIAEKVQQIEDAPQEARDYLQDELKELRGQFQTLVHAVSVHAALAKADGTLTAPNEPKSEDIE